MQTGNQVNMANSKAQYTDVHPTDNRYGTVVQIIRNSFLDPVYQPSWTIHSLKTVKNLKLFQQYKAKSEDLKRLGRDVSEYDMFTCYKTMDLIRSILEHGLQTRQSSFNFLGDSQRGVNLCKHADIQLKAAENTGQDECYLIIYKVMLGKALRVYPSHDNQQLAPTDDFDSHISSLSVDRSIPLGQQAIRSQVFCYEYQNGQLSSCPRHVLPYVVVCYKRSGRPVPIPPYLSMPQRPTMRPPPPPLVQMAPAPVTKSLPQQHPRFYHPQQNNEMHSIPDFQPRLPPRNPFSSHALPAPPSYQTTPSMQYTGMRLPAMSHVASSIESGGMMIPNVPRSEQHVTGMRLPYVTPPAPPIMEPPPRLIFNTPIQHHMPPNVTVPDIQQQYQGQQRFSMFNNTTIPAIGNTVSGTGMTIPIQVPSSAPTTSTSALSESNIGMRLPIIIQPEEAVRENETGQIQPTILHNGHMRLPTMLTENHPMVTDEANSEVHAHRASTPPDIKPDISKIDLRQARKRLHDYEPINIDQDATSVSSPSNASMANPLVIVPSEDNPELMAALDLTSNRQVSSAVHANVMDPSNSTVDLPSGDAETNASGELNKHTVSNQAESDSITSVDKDDCIGDDSNLSGRELTCERINQSAVARKLATIGMPSPARDNMIGDEADDTLPDLPDVDVELNIMEEPMAENTISATQDLTSFVDSVSVDITSRSTKRKKVGNEIPKTKAKKKRRLDPFLVTKHRRKKRKNIEPSQKKQVVPKMSMYASLQDPVLQENPVFKFCRDGSIEMYYDIYDDLDDEQLRTEKLEQIGPPRTLMVLDVGISEMKLADILNEIDDDNINIAIEGKDGIVKFGVNNQTMMNSKESRAEHVPSSSSTVSISKLEETTTHGNLDDRLKSDILPTPAAESHAVSSFESQVDNCSPDNLENTAVVKEHPSTDDKLSHSGGAKDWKTIIKDEKFQPKVVVTDVRRSMVWNSFVAKEQQVSTAESEASAAESDDGCGMTLQISSVHSLVETQSSLRNNKDNEKLSGDVFEQFDDSEDKTVDHDIIHSSHEGDMSSTDIHQNENSDNPGIRPRRSCRSKEPKNYITQDDDEKPKLMKKKKKSRIKSKPIVDYATSSEDDDNPSQKETRVNNNSNMEKQDSKDVEIEQGSDEGTRGSFEDLLEEKSRLQNALKTLQDEETAEIQSGHSSPTVDLEAMGTQLSLLSALGKDKNTQKKDIVLNRLSKVRQELKQREGTPDYENKSTLDLFLCEQDDAIITDERKPNVESNCSESSMSRDRIKDCDSASDDSNRTRRRRKSSPTRDRLSHHTSRHARSKYSKRREYYADSHSRTGRSQRRSPERDRLRRRRSRSSERRRSSSSERYRRYKRYENTPERDTRGDSYSRSKDRSYHSPDRRYRSGDRRDARQHSRRDKSPDHKEYKHTSKDEKHDLPTQKQKIEVKDGDRKGTTTAPSLKEETDVDNMGSSNVEKEAELQDEEWLKTVENLYLNKQKKDEPPRFDGYSAADESSHTQADPSRWLSTLIRLNSKGKQASTTSTSPTKASTIKQPVTQKEPQKVSVSTGTTGAVKTNTPSVSVSTGTTGDVKTNTPSESVKIVHKENSTENIRGDVKERRDHSSDPKVLSQVEVSALVSKVLTFFPEKEDTEKMSSTISPPSKEDDSHTDRLSCRYPRRKKRSGPSIEQRDVTLSSAPTLWGQQPTGTPLENQSLEEMHQGVQCEEPQVSMLPQYSPPTISPPPSLDSKTQQLSPRYNTGVTPVSLPSRVAGNKQFSPSYTSPVLPMSPPQAPLSGQIPVLPPTIEQNLNVDMINANAVAVLTFCAVNSAIQNNSTTNVTQIPSKHFSEIPAHSRDPRVKRPSESPRAESGSDAETRLRSPRSDSQFSDVPNVQTESVRRNKINKAWQASIGAPKPLGNESVAFRDLKNKRRDNPFIVPSRHRVSSTERQESNLAVDEKFAKYLPWDNKMHPLDIPVGTCYTRNKGSNCAIDPRFNSKKVCDDELNLGKHLTIYCRKIPLESTRKASGKVETQPPKVPLMDLTAVLSPAKYSSESKKIPGFDFDEVDENKEMQNETLTQVAEVQAEETSVAAKSVDAGTKGCKAAKMWSTLLHEPRRKHDVYDSLDVDIGECNSETRSLMEAVWELESHEAAEINEEMTLLLTDRVNYTEDSLMYSDPTEGLDLRRRMKLITSGSLSEKVVRELQIEEDMRVIKQENSIKRHELDMGMKTGQLSDEAVKELRIDIDIHDIQYEKYNKELEQLNRYYKSSVVEVLPPMFRLSEEKDKFISQEGNMLFLISPLKMVDCIRLSALLEEINEYRRVVENPNATFEDQQHARIRLGWLHGERKEALCQLCLNMYRSKENLTQRFLDKLAWCKKVGAVVCSRPSLSDLSTYIHDRSQTLETYIKVLQKVQRLDNGVWTVTEKNRKFKHMSGKSRADESTKQSSMHQKILSPEHSDSGQRQSHSGITAQKDGPEIDDSSHTFVSETSKVVTETSETDLSEQSKQQSQLTVQHIMSKTSVQESLHTSEHTENEINQLDGMTERGKLTEGSELYDPFECESGTLEETETSLSVKQPLETSEESVAGEGEKIQKDSSYEMCEGEDLVIDMDIDDDIVESEIIDNTDTTTMNLVIDMDIDEERNDNEIIHSTDYTTFNSNEYVADIKDDLQSKTNCEESHDTRVVDVQNLTDNIVHPIETQSICELADDHDQETGITTEDNSNIGDISVSTFDTEVSSQVDDCSEEANHPKKGPMTLSERFAAQAKASKVVEDSKDNSAEDEDGKLAVKLKQPVESEDDANKAKEKLRLQIEMVLKDIRSTVSNIQSEGSNIQSEGSNKQSEGTYHGRVDDQSTSNDISVSSAAHNASEYNSSTNVHHDIDWRPILAPDQNSVGNLASSQVSESNLQREQGADQHFLNNEATIQHNSDQLSCSSTQLVDGVLERRTIVVNKKSAKTSASTVNSTHSRWDQRSPKKRPQSPRSSTTLVHSSSMTSASALLAKAKLFRKASNDMKFAQTEVHRESLNVHGRTSDIQTRNMHTNRDSHRDVEDQYRGSFTNSPLVNKSGTERYTEVYLGGEARNFNERRSHTRSRSRSPRRHEPRERSPSRSRTKSRSHSPIGSSHTRARTRSRSPHRGWKGNKRYFRGSFRGGRGRSWSSDSRGRGRGWDNNRGRQWRSFHGRGRGRGRDDNITKSTADVSTDLVNSITVSDPIVRKILSGDEVLVQMLADPDKTTRLASMLPRSEDRDTVFRLAREIQNGGLIGSGSGSR